MAFSFENWLMFFSATTIGLSLGNNDTNATWGAPFQLLLTEIDYKKLHNDHPLAEYVELWDGGLGHQSLDGFTLVHVLGNSTMVWFKDLDGFATNEDGFFMVGHPNGDTAIPYFEHWDKIKAYQYGPSGSFLAIYYNRKFSKSFVFANHTVTKDNLVEAMYWGSGNKGKARLLLFEKSSNLGHRYIRAQGYVSVMARNLDCDKPLWNHCWSHQPRSPWFRSSLPGITLRLVGITLSSIQISTSAPSSFERTGSTASLNLFDGVYVCGYSYVDRDEGGGLVGKLLWSVNMTGQRTNGTVNEGRFTIGSEENSTAEDMTLPDNVPVEFGRKFDPAETDLIIGLYIGPCETSSAENNRRLRRNVVDMIAPWAYSDLPHHRLVNGKQQKYLRPWDTGCIERIADCSGPSQPICWDLCNNRSHAADAANNTFIDYGRRVLFSSVDKKRLSTALVMDDVGGVESAWKCGWYCKRRGCRGFDFNKRTGTCRLSDVDFNGHPNLLELEEDQTEMVNGVRKTSRSSLSTYLHKKDDYGT